MKKTLLTLLFVIVITFCGCVEKKEEEKPILKITDMSKLLENNNMDFQEKVMSDGETMLYSSSDSSDYEINYYCFQDMIKSEEYYEYLKDFFFNIYNNENSEIKAMDKKIVIEDESVFIYLELRANTVFYSNIKAEHKAFFSSILEGLGYECQIEL